MKKRLLRFILILLFVGGIGVGLWRFKEEKEVETPGELVIHGNVDIREVNLSFNLSERIVEILVEEGAPVEKGQPLARVETDRLKLAVSRNEARVAAQREVVAELEAGTRVEEIKKARAELEAEKEKTRNAERTYRRLKSLAEKNLASRQDADDAEAAMDVARARVKAASEALNLAVAGPRRETVAAARQQLKIHQAELQIARRDLEDAVLQAPSDGVVRNRILQEGDMASPQRPVLTLALTDPVWVRAYVSETDLGKIFPGMAAAVKTDSFPDKVYDGWVGYISPTAEFTPKAVQTAEVRTQLVYQTRVFVRNPRNELRLGMPADVVIFTDRPESNANAFQPSPFQATRDEKDPS